MWRSLSVIGSALVLCACTSISASPIRDIVGGSATPQLSSVVATGLQNADFNLQSGIAVGRLQASDAVAGCVASVVQMVGIPRLTPVTGEVQPAPPAPATPTSFTPKRSDLISEGSIVYVLAQGLKGGGASLSSMIPNDCLAIQGKLLIDGLTSFVP